MHGDFGRPFFEDPGLQGYSARPVKLHEGLNSIEVPNFESNIKWNNNLLSIANSQGLIFHIGTSEVMMFIKLNNLFLMALLHSLAIGCSHHYKCSYIFFCR